MDGLVGNAGWAGAGLLGLVLCWLFFFHLPAKDKQVKELTDALLALSKETAAQLIAAQRESAVLIITITDKHGAALNTVVSHCKEDSNKLVEAFRAELSRAGDKRAQQT